MPASFWRELSRQASAPFSSFSCASSALVVVLLAVGLAMGLPLLYSLIRALLHHPH